MTPRPAPGQFVGASAVERRGPSNPRLYSVLVLTCGFILIGCESGSSTATAPEPSSTSPTATQTQTPADTDSSSLSPSPSASDTRPRFVVSNGKVQGPRRITAKLGDQVAFLVTVDASDEVHVHTYDVSVPVKPGRPATVRVKATIPGVFEIELEESAVVLTQLRVNP